MFGIKSFINYSNNHSSTSNVSSPNINYIVCWLTIISVLKRKLMIIGPSGVQLSPSTL